MTRARGRVRRIGVLLGLFCWVGWRWFEAADPDPERPPPSRPRLARAAWPREPSRRGFEGESRSVAASAARRDSGPPAAEAIPPWLAPLLEDDGTDVDAGEREIVTNEPGGGDGGPFDPRQLAVLRDIIEANGLSEDSSLLDYDDGDGVLEPWELGFQVWRGRSLVALLLGPDPLWSFGYSIHELPPTISDLHRLRLLDVHGNRLVRLPDAIGDLAELRELRAQRNRIAELPERIGELGNLETLIVGQNALTGLPESLGDLRNLESLHVNDNPLAALPEALGSAERLRTLGIDRPASAVEVAGREQPGLADLPRALEGLPELSVLYVAGNRLTCAGPGSGALPRLANGRQIFGLSAQRCGPNGS